MKLERCSEGNKCQSWFTEGKRMSLNRYVSRFTTLALLLGFAVGILASYTSRVSANPSFSNDFSADIIAYNLGAHWTTTGGFGAIWDPVFMDGVDLNYGPLGSGFTGEADLFYDYTGNRAKYQIPDPLYPLYPLDIYNFYDEQRSYLDSDPFNLNTGGRVNADCTSRAMNGEMPDIFGWLVAATQAGACQSQMTSGTTGTKYELNVGNGRFLEFCSSTDQRIPYWLTWNFEDKVAWVIFKTYVPGRPPSSRYYLPDKCSD